MLSKMSASRLFGLIGNPVSQSLSRDFFLNKFAKENIEADYQLFQLESVRQVLDVLRCNPSLVGFNVTHPFKQDIIPLLDSISPDAETVQAVNVVKVIKNEKLISLRGYNTDIIGFRDSIARFQMLNSALILGTGGAARAVAFALGELQIPYVFVSRHPSSLNNSIGYCDIDSAILRKFPLIINATPVGLNSNLDKPSLPYELLTSNNFLYDLIYSPAETAFLREGKSRGCATENGLKMLYIQAEESWRIWNC